MIRTLKRSVVTREAVALSVATLGFVLLLENVLLREYFGMALVVWGLALVLEGYYLLMRKQPRIAVNAMAGDLVLTVLGLLYVWLPNQGHTLGLASTFAHALVSLGITGVGVLLYWQRNR